MIGTAIFFAKSQIEFPHRCWSPQMRLIGGEPTKKRATPMEPGVCIERGPAVSNFSNPDHFCKTPSCGRMVWPSSPDPRCLRRTPWVMPRSRWSRLKTQATHLVNAAWRPDWSKRLIQQQQFGPSEIKGPCMANTLLLQHHRIIVLVFRPSANG